MASTVLLVVTGILCLIGTVLCVVFTTLSFANNRSGRFIWLTGFLVSLIGTGLCIYLFITKAVTKMKHFSETLNEHMEDSLQNLSDSMFYQSQTYLLSNRQIMRLKSYSPDSAAIPDQFYYYLGFESYYRYPLRYPYSIHCNTFREDGELFNEAQVQRFDENDNGEIHTGIDHIHRIALDAQYLLIDRQINSTRSPDPIHHYVLFHFESGKSEEVFSEKELFKLAERKGYRGPGVLMSIQEYHELFQADANAVQ